MIETGEVRHIDPDSEVGQLITKFRTSNACLVVDYSHLNVAALSYLRRCLREGNAGWTQFEIVRNTLARIAADHAGLWDLRSFLTGVTALIFVDGDVGKIVTAVKKFSLAFPLPIKVGVVNHQIITAEQILELGPEPETPAAPVVAEDTSVTVTHDVTLVSAGRNRIAVIKALRQMLMLGLAEAKTLADSAPVVVAEDISEERADKLIQLLEAAGAEVE